MRFARAIRLLSEPPEYRAIALLRRSPHRSFDRDPAADSVWGAVPRESFQQLVSYPFRCGMLGHRNVGDLTTIVRQNHEDEQHPKENGGNHEEI